MKNQLIFNNKIFDLNSSVRLAEIVHKPCNFTELYKTAKGNYFLVHDYQPAPHQAFITYVIAENLSQAEVKEFILKCTNGVEILKRLFNEEIDEA